MSAFQKSRFKLTTQSSAKDLEKFPGGVEVTVAFFDRGRGVLMLRSRTSRWDRSLPKSCMELGESLNDVVNRLVSSVRGLGTEFTPGVARVLGEIDGGHTLQVLMLVQCAVVRRSTAVENISNIHSFTGYTGHGTIAEHLPPALGWSTGSLQAA